MSESEFRKDAENLIASLHTFREEGMDRLRDMYRGESYQAFLKKGVSVVIMRAGIGDDYYNFVAQAIVDRSPLQVMKLTRNSSSKLQQYLNFAMNKVST